VADLAEACRTLEATGQRIDALVYELYELTEERLKRKEAWGRNRGN